MNGYLRIGFFTVKDVPANTELTFDYKFQRYGYVSRIPKVQVLCSTITQMLRPVSIIDKSYAILSLELNLKLYERYFPQKESPSLLL